MIGGLIADHGQSARRAARRPSRCRRWMARCGPTAGSTRQAGDCLWRVSIASQWSRRQVYGVCRNCVSTRCATGGTGAATVAYDGAKSLACVLSATTVCAVALATGGHRASMAGRIDGRRYRAAAAVRCVTAMAVSRDASSSLPTARRRTRPRTGSSTSWSGTASGSIWRIDLASGRSTQLARTASRFPAGSPSMATPRHSEAGGTALFGSMPGRPGRNGRLRRPAGLSRQDRPAAERRLLAGLFAPRSQLVEFVLREPAYRERMMAEVPRPSGSRRRCARGAASSNRCRAAR